MKRVSKLLVPVAQNTNLAPDTITPAFLAAATDGDYVVVNKADGSAVTGAIADPTVKEVEIIVACGGNLYSSGPIKKGMVTSYERRDYAASTPRIQTLSALPAPVNGTEYVLYISNKENDHYFLPRKRFSVIADAAITTASLLGDAFASAIAESLTVTTPGSVAGTNNELGVSVANAAGVLTFTGIDAPSATPSLSGNVKYAYQVLFEVAPGDNLETVSVTRTQEPDPGCGVGSVVRNFEEVSKGYFGHLNNIKFPTAYGTGYTYQTSLAGTYDIVAIEFNSPFHTNVEGNVPSENALVLVSDATGAQLDAAGALAVILETVLDMDSSW